MEFCSLLPREALKSLDELESCKVLSEHHVIPTLQVLAGRSECHTACLQPRLGWVIGPSAERVLQRIHVKREHHPMARRERGGHGRLAAAGGAVDEDESVHGQQRSRRNLRKPPIGDASPPSISQRCSESQRETVAIAGGYCTRPRIVGSYPDSR